jgi:hypothetical protein
MSQQTRRRRLAERQNVTTAQRRASCLSLDNARQRRADDRETRRLFVNIAAPCLRRPHEAFNKAACEAAEALGVRPWRYVEDPVLACLADLLVRGSAGQLRACREHYARFLADLLDRFDREIPTHLRAEVLGAADVPLADAFRALCKEEGEALPVVAEAMARPDCRVTALRADREVADVEAAARTIRTVVKLRLSRGGGARGVLVTR